MVKWNEGVLLVSNCLFWALGQFWKKGGYVIYRQANEPRPGWMPHFLWSPDLHEFWEFAPENPRTLKPIFKGVVKTTKPVSNEWIEGFEAGIEAAVAARR